MTFPPPSSRVADIVTLRDLKFLLYRRVVEIRDGIVALRPYRDPAAARAALERCQAEGLDEETPIVVEAAVVAVAVDARHSGRLGDPRSAPINPIGGADLPSEVLALERLARCYTRSPIVRAVRAEMRSEKERSAEPEPQGIGGP